MYPLPFPPLIYFLQGYIFQTITWIGLQLSSSSYSLIFFYYLNTIVANAYHPPHGPTCTAYILSHNHHLYFSLVTNFNSNRRPLNAKPLPFILPTPFALNKNNTRTSTTQLGRFNISLDGFSEHCTEFTHHISPLFVYHRDIDHILTSVGSGNYLVH